VVSFGVTEPVEYFNSDSGDDLPRWPPERSPSPAMSIMRPFTEKIGLDILRLHRYASITEFHE
jgi:hypothetical protein